MTERSNTENEILEAYFEFFNIQDEKRNNEKYQELVLQYLNNFSNIGYFDLFMRSLRFILILLFKFILKVCKGVGFAFIVPFILFWDMLKDIKLHIKRRIFILKHKELISKLKD